MAAPRRDRSGAAPPTCGKGLAEHSVLPSRMGDLSAALAANLEAHQSALDPKDANSRAELAAYRELAKALREIAARLQGVARRMAGHRDLPMGRHDPNAMQGPEIVDAFEKLVKVEGELAALFREKVEQHRKMRMR